MLRAPLGYNDVCIYLPLQVSNIVGFTVQPTSETSLYDMLNSGLADFLPK